MFNYCIVNTGRKEKHPGKNSYDGNNSATSNYNKCALFGKTNISLCIFVTESTETKLIIKNKFTYSLKHDDRKFQNFKLHINHMRKRYLSVDSLFNLQYLALQTLIA